MVGQNLCIVLSRERGEHRWAEEGSMGGQSWGGTKGRGADSVIAPGWAHTHPTYHYDRATSLREHSKGWMSLLGPVGLGRLHPWP